MERPVAMPAAPHAGLLAVPDRLVPLLMRIDATGHIQTASEPTVRLLGLAADELVGAPLLSIVHAEDRAQVQAKFEETRTQNVDAESTGRLCNALGVPVAMELRYASAGDGSVWLAGFDVSNYVQAQADLRHLATHDALTGLPNRTLLSDRIDHHIARVRRNGAGFSVLVLDLDGFKKVNDSLGHLAGDRLLEEAARRLRGCVREMDTVSRIGGDEFVVLLTETQSAADLASICQRMLATIAEPFVLGEHRVHMSASIGAASYPEHAADATQLLVRADAAMYRAKELGKDRWAHFDAAMIAAKPQLNVSLESAMYDAVRNGEFLLHYQPIMDASGMLVGCEALMRWQRADGRMVSPGEFIPLAEGNGLIALLGEYALKAACMQLRRFDDAGLAQLYISVNVSPRQLRNQQFLQKLERILRITEVRPERVVLEITESMLMHEPEAAQELLVRIREIGCRISLDDFGTGYSCLAYLQRFPISTIKIDRSFVRNLPSDPAAGAIVSAISALANALCMDCIAEGVETPEQREDLVGRGVELLQGYLFSKPMDADQFIDQYALDAYQS